MTWRVTPSANPPYEAGLLRFARNDDLDILPPQHRPDHARQARGDDGVAGCRHMQFVRALVVGIVAGAAGDEDGVVLRREFTSDRIPFLIEEPAQDGFHAS